MYHVLLHNRYYIYYLLLLLTIYLTSIINSGGVWFQKWHMNYVYIFLLCSECIYVCVNVCVFLCFSNLQVGWEELERKPGQFQTFPEQYIMPKTMANLQSVVNIVLVKISYLSNHLFICENHTKFSDKQSTQKNHHSCFLLKSTLRYILVR